MKKILLLTIMMIVLSTARFSYMESMDSDVQSSSNSLTPTTTNIDQPSSKTSSTSASGVLSDNILSTDTLVYKSGDSITFTITYTDADNVAPTYVRLMIYENDNTTGGVYQINNNQVDPGDTDYTDGKDYYYPTAEGTGYLTEIGVHRYFFYADDEAEYIRLPAGGSDFFHFEVVLHEPVLTVGTATPDNVPLGSGSPITFYVTYTQEDNIAPTYVRLVIYENDNTTAVAYQINNNQVDPGDTDYTDGKDYYYTTNEGSGQLTQLGVHRYYFYATIDNGINSFVRLPESGSDYNHVEITAAVAEFQTQIVMTLFIPIFIGTLVISTKRRQ